MKIIAFPFAGGSKYSFQKFVKNIDNFIVIEYPGRGMRMNDEMIIDIDLLMEDLFLKVKLEISTCNEYVIYGHSMGVLIGYLMCQKIKNLGLKQPEKIIVSGNVPPSINRKKLISHLPDKEFWEEVIKIGGIQEELQNHPELMDLFIPILKGDFMVIENYNHIEKQKLTIPIDVFYGTDEGIIEAEIMEWKNESLKKVSIRQLKGNHFFIFDHLEFFYNFFNDMQTNYIKSI